jgi:hypothetical protein
MPVDEACRGVQNKQRLQNTPTSEIARVQTGPIGLLNVLDELVGGQRRERRMRLALIPEHG